MKNACSATWSYSPSEILLNASIGVLDGDGRALDAGELLGDVGVLRQEPLDPAGPVDEILSSSESSSTPRIAMMSCSSLFRWRICFIRIAVS